MADNKDRIESTSHNVSPTSTDEGAPPHLADAQVQEELQYKLSDSRKIGVTGAVFLILNKMIGTGSEYLNLPPAYRRATLACLAPVHRPI